MLQKKSDAAQAKAIQAQAKVEELEEKIMNFDIQSNERTIRELHDEKVGLQTELKKMEVQMKQEEHARKKASDDLREILQSNVSIKGEAEELAKKLKRVRYSMSGVMFA